MVKKFVCRLCLLINFIFLFNSENINFYHCTVQYQIFDFRFFVFLYLNFYCFQYLDRSYGRFVLVIIDNNGVYCKNNTDGSREHVKKLFLAGHSAKEGGGASDPRQLRNAIFNLKKEKKYVLKCITV